MTEIDTALHRQLGVDLFNLVWDYLDKPERMPQDDDRMLNAAHASRYHWEQAGTPVNLARGEWQLARVYAVLKRAEPAGYHATRCLEICLANGIGDFDLAFAYEALARASAVAGNYDESRKWLDQARQAAQGIREADDRELLEKDLATIVGGPEQSV
jgi:hypothetical protein